MPTLLPHGPLNPVSYDRCGTVSGRCIDISRTSEPVMSIINSNLVLSSNVGLAKYCQDGHLHGSNLVRVSPAKYLQTGDWKVPQGFQSFTLTISFLALALTWSFIRHLLWLSSAGVPVGLDTTKPKMCIAAPTETFP